MAEHHGVITGLGVVDWFPDLNAAQDFAQRQHVATGVTTVIVDDTFNPVGIFKS
jgi:hypothetical protein